MRRPRFVDRIGLAVGVSHLRAVGLRAGRIVWALESALTDDEALVLSLQRFLRELPVQRWPRPAVRAVLGSRHAQVKRLTGLPPGLDVRQLARLVQEGAPRFFLRNGHPLVTTSVAVAADGARWSGALDADAVDALRVACRGAGLRLAVVGPTVVALPLALEGSETDEVGGEEIRWSDEGEGFALQLSGGRLARVTRTDGAASESDGAGRPRALLAPLADRASRFADSCGAALLAADAPLLYPPQRSARVSAGAPSRVPLWRTAIALVALLLAGAAALLARPLAAARAEHAATMRLAALSSARADAARVQHDLAQVSVALTDVERFAATRRSPTLLLADLARALPQGSALVMVRLDTSGVVATLLAPRAAPVLGAIEKLSGVVSPQIIGPVTREVIVGGAGASAPTSIERTTLERMTIRFRFATATPTSALVATATASAAGEVEP